MVPFPGRLPDRSIRVTLSINGPYILIATVEKLETDLLRNIVQIGIIQLEIEDKLFWWRMQQAYAVKPPFEITSSQYLTDLNPTVMQNSMVQ